MATLLDTMDMIIAVAALMLVFSLIKNLFSLAGGGVGSVLSSSGVSNVRGGLGAGGDNDEIRDIDSSIDRAEIRDEKKIIRLLQKIERKLKKLRAERNLKKIHNELDDVSSELKSLVKYTKELIKLEGIEVKLERREWDHLSPEMKRLVGRERNLMLSYERCLRNAHTSLRGIQLPGSTNKAAHMDNAINQLKNAEVLIRSMMAVDREEETEERKAA
jgi:hypothetical protein